MQMEKEDAMLLVVCYHQPYTEDLLISIFLTSLPTIVTVFLTNGYEVVSHLGFN